MSHDSLHRLLTVHVLSTHFLTDSHLSLALSFLCVGETLMSLIQ